MSDARDEIRRAVVSLALELPQGVYTDFYDKIMKVIDERDAKIAKLKEERDNWMQRAEKLFEYYTLDVSDAFYEWFDEHGKALRGVVKDD